MVNDMDYKSTIKKHSVIIAICVICSVLLVAGTSYALFFQVNVNTENQVVKTGKLEVTYGEESSRISLDVISPMMDNNAMKDDNYSSKVKIKNTGSLPANYSLKLEKDIETLKENVGNDAEFIDLDYIRFAAYVNNEQIIAPSTLGDIDPDSEGMYNLYIGTIGVEESIDVTVKVWLDQDTPSSETDKYVYLNLRVESVVDEASTPEGQLVE